MTWIDFENTDAAWPWPPGDDLAQPLNLCGDTDPRCATYGLGPTNNKPFPLPTDGQPDPAAAATGVRRDANGWLVRDVDAETGIYSYVFFSGGAGSPVVQWYTVAWDAEVPDGTSLTMHARSGPSARPDPKWGVWTSEFGLSPADLASRGVLVPNYPDQDNAFYLQVEFTFRSTDPKATPKLKSFDVAFKVGGPPG